ncbi:methionyl-tRNA formyltransferase [Mycoplasma enhydrae]|uniref:methionyl-tRNA formyltransferase n=1 Tax=Mycoplasma enhydrae TaxID=2499220 RepID=UPI0021E9814B|nr:methionyl-tRNA formyltransferase [Mycoplasma enhydrae]MCV3733729.1 methionyl-tRNA formyltransferase [Mycoplasma enhydrae]
MSKIKLVLAGTASFSKTIFESLIEDSRFEVCALISQPNKKLSRDKKIIETEVASLAKKYNIQLFQPNKINEIYEDLKNMRFDFFITASFGQFVPNNILELAKNSSLNVHGSLLEKYRGAAPIQHALLNNETKTGISLIYMINKMDAGDILFSQQIEIKKYDTALEIFDKLAQLASQNLGNWLIKIYNGDFKAKKQNEDLVTFAPKIKNEDAELFLNDSKEKALAKIRAFNDQPGAFIFFQNKRLKIFKASIEKISSPISIDFSNGKLYLIEYQFEGKKRVKHEF